MKRIIRIGILMVFVAGIGFMYTPAYRHLMAGRMLRAAEREAAQGHDENAERFYRLAIQRDPNDTGTLRSYADFLYSRGSRGVLAVRLRITQLEPGDAKARLDAAQTALELQKVSIARELLAKPTAEMEKFPRYYDLLGWMQYLSHDLANADAVWSAAVERDPGNKIDQANLAMVRLAANDAAVRKAAVAKLTEIALGDQPPLSALASLMVNATQSETEPGKLDALLGRFQELVPVEDPFYTNYLDALRRWRPAKFKTALGDYCARAREEPYVAMEAQAWMVQAGLYEEFLAFRKSLPDALRDNYESALMAAEALFNLGRTGELEALLKEAPLNNIKPLQLALRERMRRTPLPAGAPDATAAANWTAALAAAQGNDAMLAILARLAFTWGWTNEYAQTLWAEAQAAPASTPDMLETLFRHYVRMKDARGVRKVLEKQLELQPENAAVRNNFAFLSFLLGVETGRAQKMIDDLCAAHPGTALYVSTRAFGLYRSGKAAEGRALFDKIDVKQLKGTAPGVCYGYLLAAEGNKEALAYLEGAEKWADFPEEVALIEAARKGVAQP